MPIFGPPATPYSVGYLIDRTFDLLLGAAQEELNFLTDAVSATDTAWQTDLALANLTRGIYVAVDDEVVWITGTQTGTGSSGTIEVKRAMKGTTATAHNPDSVLVVNPFFTRYQVRQTLQDEIRSWAPQVFAVKTETISITNFVSGYDLGAIDPWLSVLDVKLSPDLLWSTPSDQNPIQCQYKVIHSADKTMFPSGNALVVTNPQGVWDSPRTIQLVYAAPIDVDTTFNDGDLLTDMGMDTSDLDIPPYGAAWRLAVGREMRRMLTEAQGQVSDLTNFPAGYAVGAAEKFKELRDSRLGDAIYRLQSQYPIRMSA